MPDTLMIEQDKLLLQTEEGLRFSGGVELLDEMFRRQLVPPGTDIAIPDGVKFLDWRPPWFVVVHQTPPAVRPCRWLASDSPVPFGPGSKYRAVSLSLPYCITIAQFEATPRGLTLTGDNELYFTCHPLQSRSDTVLFPALLNISRVDRGHRHAAWICTQHLDRDGMGEWPAQLDRLLRHTFDGAFNYSSEHHEGASWYSTSRKIPRLHPVEEWQQASRENPCFALSVPWIPAGITVGELVAEKLGMRGETSRSASLTTRFTNFLHAHHARDTG